MNDSTIRSSNNNNRIGTELSKLLRKPLPISMSIQCLECEMENSFHDIVGGCGEITGSEDQGVGDQEKKSCRCQIQENSLERCRHRHSSHLLHQGRSISTRFARIRTCVLPFDLFRHYPIVFKGSKEHTFVAYFAIKVASYQIGGGKGQGYQAVVGSQDSDPERLLEIG
jgi:hypothetical protein